jgi:hypothetical protein
MSVGPGGLERSEQFAHREFALDSDSRGCDKTEI